MSRRTSEIPGRTPFHAVDWADDGQVVAFVQAAWAHRPAEQIRAELLGELATAYYEGEQYLRLYNAGGAAQGFRMEPLPNPNGRLRLVFNLYGPHADQWIARMALDPLDPEAVPSTGSQADLDATRLQTAVCRYYRDRLDLGGLKDEFVRLIGLEGFGVTKVVWEPLAGTEFTLSRDEGRKLGLTDETFGTLFDDLAVDRATLATGDPAVENVSLRNLTWGPVGVKFRQAEYVVEARERSIGYLAARWGLKPADIEAAYGDAARRWYRGGFDSGGSVVDERPSPELALTYELWAPRSAAHPRGLHAVVIGERVVNRRRNRVLANPYAHGRVPYVACGAVDLKDQALPRTPLWDGIQPQDMINRLASQIMESIEQFANPRLWAQENEIIDEWELTSRPGGLHRYRHKKPEVMEGTQLPPAVYAVLDRWIRVLQECLGIHDVSMGKAPAQGRSGRYVLALQDADNTRMGPTLKAINRWGSELFRLLLATVRQYATEQRLIAIRGQDNVWERRAFRGQELAPGADTSGPEAFNIAIRTSGQARSRAAQIELVTMLIQFGFYDPKNAEDRREVRTILELGDMSVRMDPDQAHRDLQRRVHEVLLAGRYVAPRYYHHHELRLAELRRFMNSPEYEKLAPEVQRLFVRYERDTIRLQATRKLETEALVQEATAEFQQQRLRRSALAKMGPQLGNLEATAPPGERPAVARFLNGPRASVLANFLAQAEGLPEPQAA